MSFSSEVKEKLCGCKPKCAGCLKAELAGMIGCPLKSESGASRFSTENIKIAEHFKKCLFDASGIRADFFETGKLYRFELKGDAAAALNRLLSDGVSLDKRCCKSAYIRGAFLGGGSVTDPKRSYHLEIKTRYEENIPIMTEILSGRGIDVKSTCRKGMYIIYVKECERIADILAFMGASGNALQMFSVQVEKEIRNGVNRLVNCETANTDKLARAASRQLAAIEKLRRNGVWGKLPDTLREIGDLRAQYPEDSLKELGERVEPPIGKSGVNHRLSRIISLAEDEG